MNSVNKAWLNVALALIPIMAPYITERLENNFPTDGKSWTIFLFWVIAQAVGAYKLWQTNTIQQAKAVEAVKDATGSVPSNVVVVKNPDA